MSCRAFASFDILLLPSPHYALALADLPYHFIDEPFHPPTLHPVPEPLWHADRAETTIP